MPWAACRAAWRFLAAGDRLFVTNSWDDTLSVIDTRTLAVVATWSVGAEPSGVVEDRAGKRLFVANRISNDVAVLDARTGAEQKRLHGGARRQLPYSLARRQPDLRDARLSQSLAAADGLENRTAPESEITVIDAARAVVVDRIPLHSIAGVFHLAFSADGRLGAVAEYHPKNLVPLAHLEHGGAFAYTLTLFGADVGKPVEVPLDELDRYASQPFGVAIAPDKSRLYVTVGGSECVLAIDVPQPACISSTRGRAPRPDPSRRIFRPARNYVVARIPVGHNPRGLALSRDGRRLFVANRLDDTISVIDTRTNRVATTIALAGPKTVNVLRHGEQTFYSARYSFQGQIGCSSCHIDSTFDGLTWDLEPDGFGARHCRQPAARGLERHRALQVEWRQPQHSHGVRPADGEILLAFGNVTTISPSPIWCSTFAAFPPAQPLAPAGLRAHAGAGARQSALRARGRPVRQADSGNQPLLLLPQRQQRHQPEVL